MAKFVVNVTLIAALLVLLVGWAVTATRRRRHARGEHAQQRQLILSAFTAAAGATPAVVDDLDNDDLDDTPPTGQPSRAAHSASVVPAPTRPLDAESIAALLDVLEDRRPIRRGAITGLFTSPRSVWSAGTRAGQSIPRHATGKPDRAEHVGAELYREAAGELVDIYAHNPDDARNQYASYAAAVGDPALAEIYVRSAAYATYADHSDVAQVVDEITRRATHPPEVSDDATPVDM